MLKTRGFVGLDFDCTITVRHFYKCVAPRHGGAPSSEAAVLGQPPHGEAFWPSPLRRLHGVAEERGREVGGLAGAIPECVGVLWERRANSLMCIGALAHAA